jgi:hypothetical protein
MNRLSLSLVAALMFVTGEHAAFAQGAPMPPADQPPPFMDFPPPGPGFAVINDLEHLQRLYDLNGRPAEMTPIYRDVLKQTKDPMVRHFVYDALARTYLHPANPDEAIATIRSSLAEDLTALANHPEHGDGHEGPPPAR